MISYEDAKRTKNHYEEILMSRHSNIVSIATQIRDGVPVIVVGVGGFNIPTELKVPNEDGSLSDKTVQVIVEKSGPVYAG